MRERGGRPRTPRWTLLCGALATIWLAAFAPSAQAGFGFLPGAEGFHVAAEKQDTTPVRQAGSHPYRVKLDVGLNTTGGESDGDLRDLAIHLPPGLLINPTAVSECSATAFHTHRSSPYEASLSGESCPNSTQVGTIAVDKGGTTRHFGLFNLVAPFGDAAAIGASPWGTPLVFASKLRESDSGLDLLLEGVPQSFDLQGMKLTIWGTPWEGIHDPQRGNCLNEETGGSWGECLVFDAAPAPESLIKSYLTMPTTPCDAALGFSAAAHSWQGQEAGASAATATLKGLAGPYHGAPLSTVAIDSATIGPFDLGTVVVRSAIRIDPRSAQASIDSQGSDPIPHILAGIPLHLRDIRVYVDKPDFTLNPTSCDPSRVTSTLGGSGADPFNPADDATAASTQRFQVLNCPVLGFKPRLSIALAKASHGAYPALKATYRPRAGDANLQAVSVTLPPSLFLAQEHIKDVCTKVQFNRENCPSGSIYGTATAITPLMEQPLTGPVYLRASSHAVPDLVADLKGRGIEIEVPGRIDTSRGGIRASFESLPDAPVAKFTMSLQGGSRGLLQNGEALCAAPQRANARFLAQSNATEVAHPRLGMKCAGHRRNKGKGGQQ